MAENEPWVAHRGQVGLAPARHLRIVLLTVAAMVAFAANSVLCRTALAHTAIDPATFTLVRIASGAALLWMLARAAEGGGASAGSWRAAAALVVYAACFSFAYVSLAVGTGALLLFGAVQASMVLHGLLSGERLSARQWGGLALAIAGVVVLVAPGVTAPDPIGAVLMAAAGAAWGVYSLLGRTSKDKPLHATAGNFVRALPLAAAVAVVSALTANGSWDVAGLVYAVLSGAVASGLGYVVWYGALPGLTAARAASVQLSVPVITAVAGVAVLDEALTLRLALASAAVLGGIALVVRGRRYR